jgi:hypothetical protein
MYKKLTKEELNEMFKKHDEMLKEHEKWSKKYVCETRKILIKEHKNFLIQKQIKGELKCIKKLQKKN